MSIFEREEKCEREDEICPARDLLEDIEDIRDDLAFAKISLDSVMEDPFSSPEEERIWKLRRNTHYVELRSSERKYELITEGKEPDIKLCDICPYRKILET